MAPNSHVMKWLVSSYQHILRRNKFNEAVEAVPECLRRPMQPLESLEQRIMLSSTIFNSKTVASYVSNPTLTVPIRDALVHGLTSFAPKLGSLADNGAFKTDAPGVLEYDIPLFGSPGAPKPKNLADFLGDVGGTSIGDVIDNNIVSAINGTAIGSLLSSISVSASGHLGLIGGPHFDVSMDSLAISLVSGDTYQVTSHITLDVTDTDDDHLFFDLGRNADQFAIRPTTTNAYFPSFSNAIPLKAGFDVGFDMGVKVDLTQVEHDGDGNADDLKVNVVNDDNDFFINNANLAATAKIDDSSGNHSAPGMQIGFLDVNLKLDHFKLDGKINLALNNNGTINFANFNTITTTASTPPGLIDADVSVTVDDVSGTGFRGDFHAPPNDFKIQFFGNAALGAQVSSIAGSSDPRTAPRLKLNGDALSNIGPFKNLNAGSVVGLLKAFTDRLGALPASSVLNLPLPLTKGKTLGDLLPLGTLAANKLIFDSLNNATKLVDKDGNPQFTSVQTLTNKLSSLLGLSKASINPTYLDSENGSEAHKLLFTIGFDAPFDPAVLNALKTSDIGFNLDLGKIAGIESSAKVKLTPSGHIGFTFGVDLTPGGSQPITLAPPLVDAQIRSVLKSGTGAVQTPSNGVLTSTAAFKLTIGGSLGGTVTVVLTPADTAGNTSVADLVSDLQTKINAAIDAVPTLHSTHNSKNLVQASKLADGRLVLSSPFSTFLQLKKVI